MEEKSNALNTNASEEIEEDFSPGREKEGLYLCGNYVAADMYYILTYTASTSAGTLFEERVVKLAIFNSWIAKAVTILTDKEWSRGH